MTTSEVYAFAAKCAKIHAKQYADWRLLDDLTSEAYLFILGHVYLWVDDKRLLLRTLDRLRNYRAAEIRRESLQYDVALARRQAETDAANMVDTLVDQFKYNSRDLAIIGRVRAGDKQRDVAARFGLSQGRVSQIITRFKKDAAQAVKAGS